MTFARENKAFAQKVIAHYLEYAEDQTVCEKLSPENGKNLKYVEEMKLEHKIVF